MFQDALDPYLIVTRTSVGAQGGDWLPSFNAATLQLRTGLRGKSYRGSKHFGTIAESDTTNDELTSGALTRWATMITAYLAGITDSDGNTWLPIVWSRLLSNMSSVPTVIVANQVTSCRINKTLGYMRHRKQKTVV
jgi:hypothetical protein